MVKCYYCYKSHEIRQQLKKRIGHKFFNVSEKKAGDTSKSNKKVQSTIDMGKFVRISVYYLKSC